MKSHSFYYFNFSDTIGHDLALFFSILPDQNEITSKRETSAFLSGLGNRFMYIIQLMYLPPGTVFVSLTKVNPEKSWIKLSCM